MTRTRSLEAGKAGTAATGRDNLARLRVIAVPERHQVVVGVGLLEPGGVGQDVSARREERNISFDLHPLSS